jgi:integrase/recombinase XerC
VYRGAGLRRAEALTLPWAHVLEDRILIQRVDADGSTWLPKGKAARAVVFPDWNRWMLDELSQGRSPRRTVVPQINEDAVSRTFVKIMGTIADGLTLHSLRHTAITELLERGWPVACVRVWAGHQHLATTERYTHVAVEHRIRRLFEAYREIT